MKGPAIDQLVYETMFPKPKPADPQNFQGLLQRNLVPEVRLETQAFYGHLSSQEAKYPGLDYSYQPHRVRLSRYPWHRRLFRAFDNLGLTKSEIAGLTKWEGTRWAKERFEREQNIVIRDTTADGIADWVEPELRVPMAHQHRHEGEDMEDIQEDGEAEDEQENGHENDMDEDGDEDSDAEITSVGVDLNERLRAAVAQREAGNHMVLDEEWEQWLKDAVEAGGLPFPSTDLSPNANIPGTRPASDPPMHPRLLNAARLGQWQQIPDFLHSIVRQNIEANNLRMENTPPNPLPTPASNSSVSNSNSNSNSNSTSSSGDSSPFLSRPSLAPRARNPRAFASMSQSQPHTRSDPIDIMPPSNTNSSSSEPQRRPLETSARARLEEWNLINSVGRRPFTDSNPAPRRLGFMRAPTGGSGS